MQNLGRLSEGLLSNTECVTVLSKNNYTRPPQRHQEPRSLSWQWSVRSGPQTNACKDLCVPKSCPKKRFFLPRFKKSYIPVEKKSCTTPKQQQTWKEYFSFLLPEAVAKPPLATCRKLQARRRKCCGNPYECGAYCLRDNCCPVPKEWYGQAVVYEVPAVFPVPTVLEGPKPCAPPPPPEPANVCAETIICPEDKEELNMDEYAYKKPFSGINACDEGSKPCSFKCKNVCLKDEYSVDSSSKLSCGFSPDLKDVQCPESFQRSTSQSDLPPLVCEVQEASKPPPKDINVEVKKAVCERTTFLKPYKYGEKYPVMGCRSFHTLTRAVSESYLQNKSYSTDRSFPKIPEPSPSSLAQSEWLAREKPAFVQSPNYYQPSRSGLSIQSLLTKPISGTWREDGMYVPPENREPQMQELMRYYDAADIDPELLALAEETRKTVKYAKPPEVEEEKNEEETKKRSISLAKKLSDQVTQRLVQRAREGAEDNSATRMQLSSYGRNKLSLLKPTKSPVDLPRANFMTDTIAQGKNSKKDEKNKKICSGCSGIREAEKEAECPTPKSFLDCKVRAAGRCRGPERRLYPGEPAPNNPYYKNKAKPYSLCNKPRPPPEKHERPYKLPCEDSNKRKFHTSALMSASSPTFTTLCDLVKSRGISLNNKAQTSEANAWDSHTLDSYQERDLKDYDSVPDLGKIGKDDMKLNTLKTIPFSGIPLKNSRSSIPKPPTEYDIEEGGAFTAEVAFNANSKANDWGLPQEPPVYDKEKTESAKSVKPKETNKVELSETKSSDIQKETVSFNLWESPGPNSLKRSKNLAFSNETSDQNKQESAKDLRNAWSNNSFQNLNPLTNRTEEKPTKLSVLFKSREKDVGKRNDMDSTLRNKDAMRISLSHSALD